MTIHVTIKEAETRFAELYSAARNGERVVITENGVPGAVALAVSNERPPLSAEERKHIAAKRKAAFGMLKTEFAGLDTTVPRSMTDEELDERFERKFGRPA